MSIIICQHTGIPFEAVRGAEKNHPRIRELLKTALAVSMYGPIVDRLREAREAGLTDIGTIIEFARTGDPQYLKVGQC